jgi:hypothetical protein
MPVETVSIKNLIYNVSALKNFHKTPGCLGLFIDKQAIIKLLNSCFLSLINSYKINKIDLLIH